ncbi:MAG: sulfite exporter TauE/SafE family protein, partial [Chloroflexi bacterium]
PYLLLLATVLFALSGPITTRLRGKTSLKNRQSWLTLVGISSLQLIIAIYGGYFGGGIGILMLATLGLMGIENIHEMNAMKTLLTTFINGAAVIIFIIRGIVEWPQAIVMVVGAIIGGYTGAYFARKIDQRWIRGFVILVGVSMTIYFFLRSISW